MAIVAGWWGIWDIIAGLIVAGLWARHTKKRTGSSKGDATRHGTGGEASVPGAAPHAAGADVAGPDAAAPDAAGPAGAAGPAS